jgi:hypothetical protein
MAGNALSTQNAEKDWGNKGVDEGYFSNFHIKAIL